MKTLSQMLLSSLFVLFLFACSSDDGDEISDTGPDFSISELQGTWNATSMVFSYSGPLSSMPEPSSYDVIADGGSATLTVQADGRFTIRVTLFGSTDAESNSGRMYFEDGEFFAIQFDEDPPDDPTYFGATLVGNTFTLNGGPDTVEYDFDGNDVDEPASLFVVFERA